MSLKDKKERLQELRYMGPEKLDEEENNIRQKIFELRQQELTGRSNMRLEKPHLLRRYKKELERIKGGVDVKQHKRKAKGVIENE